MRLNRQFFFILFFVPFSFCRAQVSGDSASVKGSTFSMKNSATFWMGANYRKEWNTPVTVPVLNMAREYGGLTPVKRGGGKQTKSLRLEGGDGRQYTLRSIQKFITAKTLPGDLESEAAADLVSDGVSASYPYAALSMQVLSDAAGVPYGKVKLVYIPDDPRLGEYRKDFANMLATLEERLPASVSKGYDTDEVADKLENDNDNDIDHRAIIRARLLDMFVMDFDRHEDQWQWGAVENNRGGKTFYPIPRDRDQAFYINRGFLPGFVKRKSMVPQLEGFKPHARSIKFFNMAARNFDHFFLVETTESDWKEEAESFVAKMTDDVIDRAIAQQPREIRNISGPWIAQTLKERRQYLVNEAIEYFHFLSEDVNVTGSDKKELFDVSHNDDGSLAVQVFKIDRDGNTNEKMYDRKFDPLYTKEVRLYGFGGDDKFVVHGKNHRIKVRMIGGGGSDVFENAGTSAGGGKVYDKRDGDNKIIGSMRNKMSNDSDVNKFNRLDYKYNRVSPTLAVGYNPDDGVSLGLGVKIIRHGFRKEPYKTLNEFSVTHSLSTKAWRFRYNGEFISTFGKRTDLVTHIDIRSPNNTTNFFGYGINSVYDKSKPGKFKYYRARYDLADASLLVQHRFSDKVLFQVGPTFEYYEMDKDDKLNNARFISLTGTGPGQNGLDAATLYQKQKYFGGIFYLEVDTRNNKVLPEKGILWQNTARYLGGLGNTKYDVTQLNTDFSFYLALVHDRLTFADRIGAGTNLGDGFEFYQAQYLGNNENLRGYRKDRFAGKSKFYNQAELRWRVANFKTYLFPGALGFLGFVDAGRVWVENDNDSKFPVGYGLGFWFSPLRRILLTINYGFSSEDKIPFVTLGWRF